MKNQSFLLALRYADVIDQTTPELFIEADICQVSQLVAEGADFKEALFLIGNLFFQS